MYIKHDGVGRFVWGVGWVCACGVVIFIMAI